MRYDDYQCESCFKWRTRDCEKFLPSYPNMPIWGKSTACDKLVLSDSSKQTTTDVSKVRDEVV